MNLSVTYMGLKLANPIILGASTISATLDRIRQAEDIGAGALVVRSLFAEDFDQDEDAAAPPPSSALMPRGVREHLLWLERVREKTALPLIGSLNAVTPGAWTARARELEGTGIDALELNLYSIPTDLSKAGADIEADLLRIVEEVRAAVDLPLAVKISPYFTSLPHLAASLDALGIQALVMFNRFLQPTIDPESQALVQDLTYSEPAEMRLPLRWTALLHGRIQADLALTTGIQRGPDIAAAILAGACAVQVASVLYRYGIPYIATMRRELEIWMKDRGYESTDAFRGRLSQRNCDEPGAFERAQYRQLLLNQK